VEIDSVAIENGSTFWFSRRCLGLIRLDFYVYHIEHREEMKIVKRGVSIADRGVYVALSIKDNALLER